MTPRPSPMILTPHFTLEELTHSDHAVRLGIDNTPTDALVEKLKRTAEGLEQVRAALHCRMIISSGYRSPRVNSLVGGSATSQHCKGEAADFTCPAYGLPREVCLAILDAAPRIEFDQLIYEGTWVHISFVDDAPRRSIITAHFPTREGEKTHYTQGIG